MDNNSLGLFSCKGHLLSMACTPSCLDPTVQILLRVGVPPNTALERTPLCGPRTQWRWIVEDTISRLMKCRRLSERPEAQPESSEAWLPLTSTGARP
jgi:hypothetical protein